MVGIYENQELQDLDPFRLLDLSCLEEEFAEESNSIKSDIKGSKSGHTWRYYSFCARKWNNAFLTVGFNLKHSYNLQTYSFVLLLFNWQFLHDHASRILLILPSIGITTHKLDSRSSLTFVIPRINGFKLGSSLLP